MDRVVYLICLSAVCYLCNKLISSASHVYSCNFVSLMSSSLAVYVDCTSRGCLACLVCQNSTAVPDADRRRAVDAATVHGLTHAFSLLLYPREGAMYCDQRVCLSVCLLACQKQEALLPRTDRARRCQSKSWQLLHNCMNKLYNKSI